MIQFQRCCLLSSIVFTLTAALDLTDPRVFNANFYLNTNPEVINAGVLTHHDARAHWLSQGVRLGLQGCGSFHSKQYFAKYPDLARVYGSTSYQRAIEHYLQWGYSEGRLGYVEGGYDGRYTISDSQHSLFLSASRRMAGTVDSIVWNNNEFINAYDHGRELQMSMIVWPHGECFCPNEAGSRDDGRLPTTTSQLRSIVASGNTLSTQTYPAFWLRPGEHDTIFSAPACTNGSPALNTDTVYRHLFKKRITLRCPGVGPSPSASCLRFDSTYTVAGQLPTPYELLVLEAPTGYLPGAFTVSRSLDPATGRLGAFNHHIPLVMSTPDESLAMGVYCPPHQNPDDAETHIGRTHFNFTSSPEKTNKWNVVFRKNPVPTGSTTILNYHAYICVGSVRGVVDCLLKLARPSALVG